MTLDTVDNSMVTPTPFLPPELWSLILSYLDMRSMMMVRRIMRRMMMVRTLMRRMMMVRRIMRRRRETARMARSGFTLWMGHSCTWRLLPG